MFSGVCEVDGHLILSVTKPVMIKFWQQFVTVRAFSVALIPCSALHHLLTLTTDPQTSQQAVILALSRTQHWRHYSPEREIHVNLTNSYGIIYHLQFVSLKSVHK
jgi:hypothetical protein